MAALRVPGGPRAPKRPDPDATQRRIWMRNSARRALTGAVAALTLGAMLAPAAAVAQVGERGQAGRAISDNRPGPLTERQEARRKAAQRLILSGKASPNEDGVIQLADD